MIDPYRTPSPPRPKPMERPEPGQPIPRVDVLDAIIQAFFVGALISMMLSLILQFVRYLHQ